MRAACLAATRCWTYSIVRNWSPLTCTVSMAMYLPPNTPAWYSVHASPNKGKIFSTTFWRFLEIVNYQGICLKMGKYPSDHSEPTAFSSTSARPPLVRPFAVRPMDCVAQSRPNWSSRLFAVRNHRVRPVRYSVFQVCDRVEWRRGASGWENHGWKEFIFDSYLRHISNTHAGGEQTHFKSQLGRVHIRSSQSEQL